MGIRLLIGQNLAPRAQVHPHPNVEGAHTVIDPDAPGFFPIIANKAAAEVWATRKNLRR